MLAICLLGTALTAAAGPYAPAANQPGSSAIASDSGRLVAWATGTTNYLPGAECSAIWQTPEQALGPASGDPTHVVCLGRSGQITFTFDVPIADGPGPDFAVFENGVTESFLELAFVEVSSDGATFVRFPTHSLSVEPPPGTIPNFQEFYATNIHGFASKYIHGYGTPFDLADLPQPISDPIRFVRLIDIVGDGSITDSFGNAIYDPYPMVDSAGVDIDGIGVIHFPTVCTLAICPGGLELEWQAVTNRWYQPQYAASPNAAEEAWSDVGPLVPGDDQRHQIAFTNQPGAAAVFRVVRKETP